MNTLAELTNHLDNFTGITCHSGEVKPGNIFVAIRGRVTDGNLYAPEAEKKGALAIITDYPDGVKPVNIPVITVDNSRRCLADLAARYYRHPSHDLTVIGITGSNGKTTITMMLEHIFQHYGYKTGLIGTVRVDMGNRSFPSKLTTPDAASLQYYLAQMRENGITHVPMEVSAQGVEMHRVDGVHFTCGVLTNICPDHLDFHGDFANYIAAKQHFLQLLDADTPLVVNIGVPYCQGLSQDHAGPVVTAAVNAQADISANVINMTAAGSDFQLAINHPVIIRNKLFLPAYRTDIHLSIPGQHNIENALLAAIAALLQDIPVNIVTEALAAFKGVERRMKVHYLDEFVLIDDTALNPGSIDAVFNAIQTFDYRHLIVVNAIRGQRGRAINDANASCLAQWQRKLPFALVVTAANDHVSWPDIVTTEEERTFREVLVNSQAEHLYEATLTEAISAALKQVCPGDMIVLLGAQGMDNGYAVLSSLLSNGVNLK